MTSIVLLDSYRYLPGPGTSWIIWPQLPQRRIDALKDFFANHRIVLCYHQNRGVLLQREALICDCLHKCTFGLISDALLVRRGRRLDPLLILFPNAGHLFQGSRRRIEFVVWNIRRLLGWAQRRE